MYKQIIMKSIKNYNSSTVYLNNLNIKNVNTNVNLRIHNYTKIRSNECHALLPLVYCRDMKVKEIYKFWRQYFSKSGILEPKESIENILAHVYKSQKLSDVYKTFSNSVHFNDYKLIQQFCEQRLKRMPLQYILKEWQFRDLILKMKPPVFIPRPETEMLVEIVLSDMKHKKEHLNMLEICSGSGAISIALLKSIPTLRVTAIDQSVDACELTTQNAILHDLNKEKLKVKQYKVDSENLLQDLEENFDIIVSNPPYVPTYQVATVQEEIKLYEDLKALDGGNDGLTIIKYILIIANKKLYIGGKLYLETDSSHPKMIEEIVAKQFELKLKYIRSYKDFYGKERFVKLEKI